MNPSVIFHPDSEDELNLSITFYNKQASGLGFEFLGEVERATELISRNPVRWKAIKYHVRQYIIQRFPYFIFYITEPKLIYIVAIAHQKRKPYYWKDRL